MPSIILKSTHLPELQIRLHSELNERLFELENIRNVICERVKGSLYGRMLERGHAKSDKRSPRKTCNARGGTLRDLPQFWANLLTALGIPDDSGGILRR